MSIEQHPGGSPEQRSSSEELSRQEVQQWRELRAQRLAQLRPESWADYRARYLIPTISFLAVVAVILIGGVTTPGFLSQTNMLSIIRIAALTGIMGLGMTFITMSGSFFSLSSAQTGALCSISFAAMITWGWGWPASLIATLLIAAAVGAIQGAFVAAGANPVVITIAAAAAIIGVPAILTDSRAIIIDTTEAHVIGRSTGFGVPIQTWTFIALIVIAQFVLVRTRFGRAVTLAGANREAAKAAGLPIARIEVWTFTLASITAGIAGIFVAAQSNRGLITNLEATTLEVIAAVLIGGTAIQGGEGSMIRTAFGAMFIVAINSLLVLRGYSPAIRTLVEGLAVVAGVSLFWLARGGAKR